MAKGGRPGGSGSSLAVNTKMPELSGSEKQVKWANDIRSDFAANLDALVRSAKSNAKMGLKASGISGTTPSVEAAMAIKSNAIKNVLLKETSAKKYIDKRGNISYGSIIRTMNAYDRMHKK